VVEDYRPARRGPLVYRQHIISRHNAFSFRKRNPSNRSSSVFPTTRTTSCTGFPRARAAETFPFSDHALLLALSIASVTEPATRVKDASHVQAVIANAEADEGMITAPLGQGDHPRNE
jgi:hypothetical protein